MWGKIGKFMKEYKGFIVHLCTFNDRQAYPLRCGKLSCSHCGVSRSRLSLSLPEKWRCVCGNNRNAQNASLRCGHASVQHNSKEHSATTTTTIRRCKCSLWCRRRLRCWWRFTILIRPQVMVARKLRCNHPVLRAPAKVATQSMVIYTWSDCTHSRGAECVNGVAAEMLPFSTCAPAKVAAARRSGCVCGWLASSVSTARLIYSNMCVCVLTLTWTKIESVGWRFSFAAHTSQDAGAESSVRIALQRYRTCMKHACICGNAQHSMISSMENEQRHTRLQSLHTIFCT